ncbi:MAG: hypothetical protein CM1200mP16_15580 [Nitrospina sp.]|nr:MAG: hypothetical protein CM1200mP16_15580 [Nitrospina sp.]
MISIQKYGFNKRKNLNGPKFKPSKRRGADFPGFPTPPDAVVNSVGDFKKLLGNLSP